MDAGVDPGVPLIVVTTSGPRGTVLDNCQALDGTQSYSQLGDVLEPMSTEALCKAICCEQGKHWLL